MYFGKHVNAILFDPPKHKLVLQVADASGKEYKENKLWQMWTSYLSCYIFVLFVFNLNFSENRCILHYSKTENITKKGKITVPQKFDFFSKI